MSAAWYLRSRQLRRYIRFWVLITGYDINDRSISNQIYLLYLFIFFGIWGMAMLSLITSGVAQFLIGIAPGRPLEMASAIACVVMGGWWLWSLSGAARRSPIRFNSEDAALICLTPVSRVGVVFSWLVSEWFTSGLAFWAMAVALGFTHAEIGVGGKPTWADAPVYVGNGLRFLLVVFLVHAGMQMLTWALGCWRLQAERETKSAIWVALASALMLPGAISSQVLAFSLAALPLTLPIASANGLAPLAGGLSVGLAWLTAGVAALIVAARGFNLSRAAQETETSSAISAASMLGKQEQVDSIKLKERLKTGSAPTQLPGRPGIGALPWKQAVRLMRGIHFGTIWNVLVLLLVGFGAASAPDWGSRCIAFLFWALRVHQIASDELRSDLRLWLLFLPLPFQPIKRLLVEVAPAAGLVLLLGWIVLAAAGFSGLGHYGIELALILPWVVLILSLSALFDVLRQTKIEHLLAGTIPGPGFVAVLISAVAGALVIGPIVLLGGGAVGVFAAVLIGSLIVFAFGTFCVENYRKLGS
jgi:hypothetical protein